MIKKGTLNSFVVSRWSKVAYFHSFFSQDRATKEILDCLRISIGDHMIWHAIWNKQAQINFFKD